VVLHCEGVGELSFVQGLTMLLDSGGGVDLLIGHGGNGLSPWCALICYILRGKPGLRRALIAVVYLVVTAV
jgi:hypothetical protein